MKQIITLIKAVLLVGMFASVGVAQVRGANVPEGQSSTEAPLYSGVETNAGIIAAGAGCKECAKYQDASLNLLDAKEIAKPGIIQITEPTHSGSSVGN